MNQAKKNYRKKCKRKYVTFYQKDEELYKIASACNFQKLVKDKLKEVCEHGIIQGK